MSEKGAPLDETPMNAKPIEAKPIDIDLPVEKLVEFTDKAGALVQKVAFEHVAKEVEVPEGAMVVEAVADTIDPTEVIDLVILEGSADGGKTWRELARATEAHAAPAPTNPGDPIGPMKKPGLVYRGSIKGAPLLTRTRVIHSKSMRALVADKVAEAKVVA